MTRDEWIQAVGRSFARTLPDNHPEGFAYHVATQLADGGAYEKFLAGEFPADKLYVPERSDW